MLSVAEQLPQENAPIFGKEPRNEAHNPESQKRPQTGNLIHASKFSPIRFRTTLQIPSDLAKGSDCNYYRGLKKIANIILRSI